MSLPPELIDGSATIWCEDGHKPMLINERHSDSKYQTCPECGNEYEVEVSAERVN